MATAEPAPAAINLLDAGEAPNRDRAPMTNRSSAPIEQASERLARRARTISTVVVLFVAVSLLSPAILGLTVIADLIRGAGRHRWMITRLAVFGWVFLASETIVLIGLGAAWLVGGGGRRTVDLTWELQRWWSSTLFKSLRSVFQLRFVVQGDEQIAPGPILLMMRHASIVDNLLPAGLVSLPHDIRLRYVLKKELLWDPVLDIGGQRLPNVFVRREGADSVTEIAQIRRLGTGLTERDGVLIYPEGTRFTPRKRDQAIRRLERTDPALADGARRLRRLLPPRPGGPLALLDSGADVVVCAHQGLEGLGPGERCAARRVGGEDHPRRLPPGRGGSDTRGSQRARRLAVRSVATGGRLDRIGPVRGRMMEGLGSVLIASAVAVAVAMIATWLVSLPIRNASIVDIVWGLGFVIVAWTAFLVADGADPRRWLLTALTTVWGLRLSIYLAMRNLGKEEDYRYQEMRRRHGDRFGLVSLGTVFGLQGALIWVVSLPVQAGQVPTTPPRLTWVDYLGAGVWLVGLIFESVGDWQLAKFKADPANKGKVMDRGLWHYTRHPNYFGDFMVWWGLYLIALATGVAWWTVIGPIVMSILLIQVSGKAMLEKTIGKRRPGYEDYVRRTSGFFPMPPRQLGR